LYQHHEGLPGVPEGGENVEVVVFVGGVGIVVLSKSRPLGLSGLSSVAVISL
jgi:hypothetical protein